MKVTSTEAKEIVSKYTELKALVEQFASSKSGSGRCNEVRIDDNGDIEEYVNTACNCHPEYTWEPLATAQEFNEWLDAQKE